jgi:hypothetical protein
VAGLADAALDLVGAAHNEAALPHLLEVVANDADSRGTGSEGPFDGGRGAGFALDAATPPIWMEFARKAQYAASTISKSESDEETA